MALLGFVLISRVWKFYISFKGILKTRKRINEKKKTKLKNKLSQTVFASCNKTCFSVFGLPWALQYEVTYNHEGQQLNHRFQSNNWTIYRLLLCSAHRAVWPSCYSGCNKALNCCQQPPPWFFQGTSSLTGRDLILQVSRLDSSRTKWTSQGCRPCWNIVHILYRDYIQKYRNHPLM